MAGSIRRTPDARYRDKCDDCAEMANIAFPDGPAYCNAHARNHKALGPYSMDELLDLSWHERIRKGCAA